jgi:uncharacterized protein with PhoU and TrkA domain
VAPDSTIDGRTLGELRLHTETGMEVLAVQRANRWIYRPRRDHRSRAGDRLIAIGPEEGAPRLRALGGDVRPEGEDGWIEPSDED